MIVADALPPALARSHADGRIESIEWAVAALPLARELHHSRARAAMLEAVVCRVVVDGSTGVAEVRGNAAYGTGETTADIVRALTATARRDVATAGTSVADFVGSAGGMSRLAALVVDLAAWDARARGGSLSLARLLSPTALDRVATHGQIPFGSIAEAESRAAGFLEAGLERIKMRVGGDDTHLDLARVSAVRALSASVDISVDANGAWTADAARAACRDLATLGVVWVEQPTADLAGLRAVRRDGAVRVRADESTRDVGDAALLAESADGVHLKLEKSGTVVALAAAVADAREAGLDVALGQFDQGRLGCAATLHVAAALGFAKAELWGFADVATDIAAGIELVGPGFAVPDRPGLGVDLLTPLDWTSPS